VRGADGWVLVIMRDVTRERQREIDNESARHVAELVRDTAGVTPWRYDADAHRYEVAPDFTDQVEHTEDDFREGDEQPDLIHPDDREAVMTAWDRTLATGEAVTIEYRLRPEPDQDHRRVRCAWQGVRRRPNGRWDILGVNADITEIAEARDAALAAAAAKSRFVANISHEIRTPMNGVLGVLHLIKAEPPRADRQRLVDQALAAGAGLSDLLNDIIDFSDLEGGRLELAAEPVDPAAELESVVAMFRPQAEARGVALRVLAGDVGWVSADPARLRKVFFHLVSNAVKFTHRGKVVARLSASGEGQARRLRLEVEDTGVGIAPGAEAEVFQDFSQGDGSATRQFGGQGLGLAVTRRLSQLMGGDVGYASRPGVGSTFWVEAVAPAAAARSDAGADAEAGWLAGVRVLVVEDNATNRLVATRMLGQLGAEVATAENGAEGVAAVEAEDFDLIFMDIQMPVMDGVEATRRIRALPGLKRQIPIVATTANVMPEQLRAYLESGIDGVVAKPISPAALLSEVARLANAEAA
jgi:signal transduction histidine kinase